MSLPFPESFIAYLPLLIVIIIYTVILKGIALWHAAKNNQKYWFVALLVINTLGILEILYLVFFRKKK